MKKFVAVLAACAAFGASVAFADTASSIAGNTMTVTAGGHTYVTHHNADGTYTQTTDGAGSVSGTYTASGDQLCYTPAGGAQECHTMPTDKGVGDSWTQSTDHGDITIAIAAGH